MSDPNRNSSKSFRTKSKIIIRSHSQTSTHSNHIPTLAKPLLPPNHVAKLRKKLKKNIHLKSHTRQINLEQQLENISPYSHINPLYNLILNRPNQHSSIIQFYQQPPSFKKAASEVEDPTANHIQITEEQRRSDELYRITTQKIQEQFIQKYIQYQNNHHPITDGLNAQETEQRLSSWSITSQEHNNDDHCINSTLKKSKKSQIELTIEQQNQQCHPQFKEQQQCNQQWQIYRIYVKYNIRLIKEVAKRIKAFIKQQNKHQHIFTIREKYLYQQYTNTYQYLQRYKFIIKNQQKVARKRSLYEIEIKQNGIIFKKLKSNQNYKSIKSQQKIQLISQNNIERQYKVNEIIDEDESKIQYDIETNGLQKSIENVMRYFMWQKSKLLQQQQLLEEIKFYKIMNWLIGLYLGNNTLNRIFNIETVCHICKLKQKTYYVKMICFTSKKINTIQPEVFYKCELHQEEARTKMEKLLLTQYDIVRIIGQKDNITNLDILKRLCQKLVIKKKDIYDIIGIVDTNQMFYISNQFLSRRAQITPSNFNRSFLSKQLNHFIKITQKIVKVKIQKEQYCLITVSKIASSKFINITIYLAMKSRKMSFNLKEEFIDKFQEEYIQQIFKESNYKKKDIIMVQEQQVKESRKVWNNIIDSMKFQIKNTSEGGYLICKISNFQAIVKDCSKSYYLSLKDQILLMEISLQTKRSLALNLSHPSNNEISHLAIMGQTPNIYYSKTSSYVAYVSIVNLKIFQHISVTYNLMDIINAQNQQSQAKQNQLQNEDLKQRIFRHSQLLERFAKLKRKIIAKLQTLQSIKSMHQINLKDIILSNVRQTERISLNASRLRIGHLANKMVLINRSIIKKNKIQCILYDQNQKNLIFYVDRCQNNFPKQIIKPLINNSFPFIQRLRKQQLITIGNRIKNYYQNLIILKSKILNLQ